MRFCQRDKKAGFFSFFVCFFAAFLLCLTLLEFEIIQGLFSASKVEKEYIKKEQTTELLENIMYFEKEKMENFFRENSRKDFIDYFIRTKEGNFLKQQFQVSQGGYSLVKDLPEITPNDRKKAYYVKYYHLPAHTQAYRIQVLIEYQYGMKRDIEKFQTSKLIEMRIYLE